MKCKLCKKNLSNRNKSDYCSKCYTKSPQSLKYQREYQKKWYAEKINKEKKKKYRQNPIIKIKNFKYQKKYHKKYIIHIRELKRNWEKKHRKERNLYHKQLRKRKKENAS